MLKTVLTIPDLCWSDVPHAQSPLPLRHPTDKDQCAGVVGRFACAVRTGDRVVLTRDHLGLNKLFYAIHARDGVIAGNYLSDLLSEGVPFSAIYSVPAGHVTEIIPARHTMRSTPFAPAVAKTAGSANGSAGDITTDGRRDLSRFFCRLAASFPSAAVRVCLSGGLDSALVAALAAEVFPDVVSYTYSYGAAERPTDDALLAMQTADTLGIQSRLVTAGAADVLDALAQAVRYGQDWRDFNVHCAIVNVLLAKAIAAEASSAPVDRPVLVLTGDLMNELMADYTPVRYRGRDHYKLPDLAGEALRRALVRGVQAGDREVGVFQSAGLIVAQPYVAVAGSLLRLPLSDKPEVIRALAGGRLPAGFYQRGKMRAQIGDTEVREGILPLLTDTGRDPGWLEQYAASLFRTAPSELRGFLRAGVYRSCWQYPERRCGTSGYLCG